VSLEIQLKLAKVGRNFNEYIKGSLVLLYYFFALNYVLSISDYLSETVVGQTRLMKSFDVLFRAACYTKLMSFDLALKDCEKAIELEPAFIKAYLRKVVLLSIFTHF